MSAGKAKTLKGSEVVVRCLEKLGVELVFAYPGGMAIELHHALLDSKIRVVLPRHEQGGAFAAGGYARASGRVGVCMATSGPGATNLVSGIADAYMDSIPTVFITGQVPSTAIGKNVFQETDIIGVTRPIVKHSFLVLDAEDLPRIFAEAFQIAASGRFGPVLIDIPKNIQQQNVVPHFELMDVPAVNRPAVLPDDVAAIRSMILASSRPCVYAGGGVISSGAAAALRKFAESWNLPVTTTLMGIGAFPEKHPLSLSWLGMHGTAYANYAANECDLLLAFGARFDDRVTGDPSTFAKRARIVHVDIDDSEINKNKRVNLGVVADVGDVLNALVADPVWRDYADWFRRIAEWKSRYPKSYRADPDRIQPQYAVETLSRLTGGSAVIVPGVGQHQMWAAQYYDYSFPRQLLTSGGLGAMGFGLPAALGAKLACPQKTVVNIDGDGSFQMNIQELGTLHVEEIPVKMMVFNNLRLGMVAQWEDRFYGSRRGNTVLGECRGSCGESGVGRDDVSCAEKPYPDFVTIAKGYGIAGRGVFRRSEVESAIMEMLDSDGPFLLDIHTGYHDHVLPMIPPGKDYRSIITE